MTRFSFFLLLFLTGLQVGFSQAIGTVYTGFDPDIRVDLDLEDKTKDEVIERAILELQ